MTTISFNTVPTPPRETIQTDVSRALAEDVGGGDLTAALIPENRQGEATVVCREEMVVCGRPWFDEVFRQLDPSVRIRWHHEEGEAVPAGSILCRVHGGARALLTGERTALNFLQLLSGAAGATRRCVEAAAGTPVRILDTRKTIPGLRAAQKYAVRCGGAQNHRMGLYDAYLIKENHIDACGGISTAVELARMRAVGAMVEVEVESLEELEVAITAGADVVMLDNFTVAETAEAVKRAAGRVKLEVSGGVDESAIRELAGTGVDYISVGALTKHVRAVDLSMGLRT